MSSRHLLRFPVLVLQLWRLWMTAWPRQLARIELLAQSPRLIGVSVADLRADLDPTGELANQGHRALRPRAPLKLCAYSHSYKTRCENGHRITDMSTPSTNLSNPPAPTVWPTVGFRDVDAGVSFLTEGLGFVLTALYRNDDGVVEHAEARWPDGGGVMFGSRGRPGDWSALGPQGVYIAAANAETVDTAWNRVRELGSVEVLRELHDTDYGSHQFDVRDADGNLWTVGTYRGA